jgi:hypothetical protein
MLFQPAYVTTISFAVNVTPVPPALAGLIADTPDGRIIFTCVIGPAPIAETRYVYNTVSPEVAVLGSIYA